ncbi:MAG: STAS domain-containing protein [candidate division Zixibacteria bacterium]|nr:STAS domain-containing protein [candidate division Zixibacteria bacterium]
MEFKDVLEGDVVVISISGKIMGGKDTVMCRNRLHDHLKSNTRKFVIDMGDVEWTNSQGLGMLIGCYTSVKRAGGHVALARIDSVRELLVLTRLIQVFDCYDSMDEAKEAITEM